MSVKYVWTQKAYSRTITSDNTLFSLTVKDGHCKERFATPTGLCGAEFPLTNLGGGNIDTYMEAAANSYLWRYNHENYDIAETASKLGVDCLDDGGKTAIVTVFAKKNNIPVIQVKT